ncbi:MAG: ABC transporter ATP-binding protein, partial [Chloroflexota bacterium]|nr:ABC transporter ATP-binding protein [Chloroflexota bacterium]
MSSVLPALALHEVSKHFGALKAVERVSMDIAPGERRAVIGPNGAGKTTLFHVVSGVLSPSWGRIEMFGHDVTALPTHRRIALGMARTFQVTNLFHHLTVEQNLILALQGLSGVKLSMLKPLSRYRNLLAGAERLLDEWGLIEKRDAPISELSHGERRTTEIMLAVSQKPRLLLLDEPTAGLSPAETASAAKLIKNLPRDQAILLIEHDMDVVFDLCDTMTVLHLG